MQKYWILISAVFYYLIGWVTPGVIITTNFRVVCALCRREFPRTRHPKAYVSLVAKVTKASLSPENTWHYFNYFSKSCSHQWTIYLMGCSKGNQSPFRPNKYNTADKYDTQDFEMVNYLPFLQTKHRIGFYLPSNIIHFNAMKTKHL